MAIHNAPDGHVYDDEALDCFIFKKGRYYAEQLFLPIPQRGSRFGKGGNVLTLLWRKIETPEEWVFQYRFRHYKDKLEFDSDDYKVWHGVPVAGTEEEVIARSRGPIQYIADVTGMPLEIFEIKGDCHRFGELIHSPSCPKWLHTQQAIAE